MRSQLDAIAADESLYDPHEFTRRLHAIEVLDALVASGHDDARLQDLRRRLAESDAALFSKLRAEIRAGSLRGARFRLRLDAVATSNRQTGYDERDAFLGGLLFDDAIPDPRLELETEMVHYQPTPVRVVLALVDRARVHRDDTFIDVGSGLGQVPMLVNLLIGAAAVGIELEPAYCEYARRRAADLDLRNVEFRNGDARTAHYTMGTVFFLYTPVKGEMLQVVFERIRVQTLGREVRLLTYGPCTEVAASLPWLESMGTIAADLESVGAFTSR